MKKIEELEFLGFLQLYIVLKGIFKNYDVRLGPEEIGTKYILISETSLDELEPGEIYIEIPNPVLVIESLDNINLDEMSLYIKFCTMESTGVIVEIPKGRLDTERTISGLKSLIGKVYPNIGITTPESLQKVLKNWLVDTLRDSDFDFMRFK